LQPEIETNEYSSKVKKLLEYFTIRVVLKYSSTRGSPNRKRTHEYNRISVKARNRHRSPTDTIHLEWIYQEHFPANRKRGPP